MSESEKGAPQAPVLRQTVLGPGGQQPLAPQGGKRRLADIVFCIDGTGSMGPFLPRLKDRLVAVVRDELPQIAAEGLGAAGVVDLRYRLVVFRDLIEDQVDQIEDNDFTPDVEEICRQIMAINPAGGGDAPESFLDALVVALKEGELNAGRAFREGDTRPVVVIFTDAPAREGMAPWTLERYGQKLKWTGSLEDVVTLLTVSNPRPLVFVAAPEADNPVLAYLDGKIDFRWEASEGDGLADIDLAEFLRTILKTITSQAGARTVPVRRA